MSRLSLKKIAKEEVAPFIYADKLNSYIYNKMILNLMQFFGTKERDLFITGNVRG